MKYFHDRHHFVFVSFARGDLTNLHPRDLESAFVRVILCMSYKLKSSGSTANNIWPKPGRYPNSIPWGGIPGVKRLGEGKSLEENAAKGCGKVKWVEVKLLYGVGGL
jgi:hypothetical protein